jgi:hypothetical protein
MIFPNSETNRCAPSAGTGGADWRKAMTIELEAIGFVEAGRSEAEDDY